MRYAAAIALVALALGGLPHAGAAADPTWQVSVGFGGVARDDAWTPVFADITNDGEARVGGLVVFLDVPGMKDRLLPYAAEVDLPRHSKKRYTVYVPSAGDIDSVRLEVSGYRGERRSPRVNVADPGALVVCVVGGDGGYLSFLNGQTGLGVGAARAPRPMSVYGMPLHSSLSRGVKPIEAAVGRLDWSGLPDSWLGWEGASAVVLADANFSGASPAAREALVTWVECGGTLVVPGGPLAPAVASGPFAPLLPAAVTGTAVLSDLSPVGAWAGPPLPASSTLAAQLALAPDAEVLCGSRAQPLIVSRRLGAGRVVMTSFDYTGAPVKYWGGQQAFWSKLLVPRAPEYTLARQAEAGDDSGQTAGLLETVAAMPQAELPSVWLIIGFLIAYIVVLVPVNYHVLNRINRRELAWITTPGIVLLFTFGAYGLGYAMRGGAVVVNRIGIVEAGAGAPVGHGVGYLGIFSPARTGYQVLINAPSAGSRDLSALFDPHLRPGAVIFTAAKPRIADVNMNMWTTRSFAIDYTADLGKGVSGYLESDGVNLVARVRNDTGLTLSNCRLVRGGAQGPAKNLAPGESGEVRFFQGQGTPIPLVPPNSYSGANANLGQMALAAIFSNASPFRQGAGTLPALVARVDERPVPAALPGERPRVKDVSLLILHLPIRLTSGRDIQVPEWLVSTRYVASSGTVSGADRSSGSGDLLTIDHGSVTIEYALPLGAAPVEVRKLELACSDLPTADVSAYDYTRGSWQVLAANAPAAPAGGGSAAAAGGPGGPGAPMGGRMARAGPSGSGPGAGGAASVKTLAIPHPRDFLSPEGKVQVKVSVPVGSGQMTPLALRARVVTR